MSSYQLLSTAMVRALTLLIAIALSIGSTSSFAGTPTISADLAIRVVVSPPTAFPGGVATVMLTLDNAGPDTAGASHPEDPLPNLVFQQGFRLAQSSDRGPYEIREPISGCAISEDVVGPFTDLSFGLVWSFYFPPIPAGESRTCSFPIEFAQGPLESFDTFWRTATSAEDPNPSNNRADYRFIVGNPIVSATPVPALSSPAQVLLAVSLLVAGIRCRRAVKRTIPAR